MSDANLIKDKIREELEKGLPSKRKILSYLLDLLKKDKYPSLSDFEFYDIVGYTYKLNLNYKLNLEILFYPIYNALKKKIRKLYGDEKKLEMELYLIKNFGLFSAEQTFNNIKEEFEQVDPSKISAFLSDLLFKKEYQLLSDSEFFDFVGEVFKLDPDFFMKEFYKTFRNKMGKSIGAEKRKEMEKYIIEKFCLLEDEQILYELKGNIKQTEWIEQKLSGKTKPVTWPLKISVNSADIFITNYRIIAHGVLKASGGQNILPSTFVLLTNLWILDLRAFTGGSKRAERKEAIIESSPVFGYQFPIKNHTGLVKFNPTAQLKVPRIAYIITIDNRKCNISINPSDPLKRFEHISKIFDILRKDANEVLGVINEVYETEVLEKYKRRRILGILKELRKSEEYQGISDSKYLDIVRETYKLDPQFFLESIYPKMKSWKFPSFINIKGEVIELIENLNKETERLIS